jgi:hypothetical protein
MSIKSRFSAARLNAKIAIALGGAFLSLASLTSTAALIDSGPIALPVPNTVSGVHLNVVTGVTDTTGSGTAGWDFNAFDSGTGLAFFTSFAAASNNQIVGSGSVVAALTPGTQIGPSSTYSGSDQLSTLGTAFRNTGISFIGFRFTNEATSAINYGYIQLETTAALGFPATISVMFTKIPVCPSRCPISFRLWSRARRVVPGSLPPPQFKRGGSFAAVLPRAVPQHPYSPDWPPLPDHAKRMLIRLPIRAVARSA